MDHEIKILKDKFKCRVGLSDHSKDNSVAQTAIALGAQLIEKHIALDNQTEGFDLEFSFVSSGFALAKKLNNNELDEVIMGQVLTGGSGQNPARQASIKSGVPIEKPAYLVNQVCGSGIRSIASGFQSIKSGDSKIVIAGIVTILILMAIFLL